MNFLLITLDQFRGDCLSSAGHPVVKTPSLDGLASEGVRLGRHYSQAAPCAPGRACLYTGTYQFNNRVVGNGTPLDYRFDNIARAARRAGYSPAIFGYADQSLDPRMPALRAPSATGHAETLSTYQGFPPGFEVVLDLPDDQEPWLEWLTAKGYGPFESGDEALKTEPERPDEVGVSAFMTDSVLEWIGGRDGPWFAHASYWRPHPPYAAAGRWSSFYDPDDVPLPIPAPERSLPFSGRLLEDAPPDERGMRELRAQYYGMISDVDNQLGRLFEGLRSARMWDDTFVVVTSDHGEQLGDQGTLGKGGMFESSYHIVGIVRDPTRPETYGSVVDSFTENVDIFPTLCERMGIEVPSQCDGLPLTAFLEGSEPQWWRSAAHWEYDWRWEFIPFGPHDWPWDRRLEQKHLAVLRSETAAYVQFDTGEWRCFDLAADPTWRTEVSDPSEILSHAQSMITWRALHAERTLSDMLLLDGVEGGIGRPPYAPTQI
jgi:arylsulfatase A-like enzyme